MSADGGWADPDGAGPRYRALFDAADVALLVVGLDLRMVDASPAYFAQVGLSLAEPAGRDVFEVFTADPDRPDLDSTGLLRASMLRAVQTGRTDRLTAVRYDLRLAEGGVEARWWNITNTPVPGANGVTVLLPNQVENVTDLVAERAASASAAAINTALSGGGPAGPVGPGCGAPPRRRRKRRGTARSLKPDHRSGHRRRRLSRPRPR